MRGACVSAVAAMTVAPSTVQVTSRTSPPAWRPVWTACTLILSPGRTGASIRAVQPASRRAGVSPSEDCTACWAAAESHMPWTITPPSPASSAAVLETWIGLWSPETSANAVMSWGAVSVVETRFCRVVSAGVIVSPAPSTSAPPAGRGSPSSARPVRPRMANRSVSVHSGVSAPLSSATATSTVTSTTRPRSVSRTSPDRATTTRSAAAVGTAECRRTPWSRCTRSSRPSTTVPVPPGRRAAPRAANTAGQAAPTSASGTPAEAMTSVGRLPAVTPVWSETSVGSKAKRDVATPPETSGSSAISVPPAPPRPTPAAVRRSVRMAASASASVTTGAAPVATSEPRVRVMTSSAGPIGSRRSTVAPSADGVSTAPETG